MSTTSRTRHLWWSVLRHRTAQTARTRLLVLPHSGAGPSSLRTALTSVPDDVEILGLCLPGRERRYDEPIGCTLDDVLDSFHTEILGLEPLPTVVVGHSLGSMLAARIAQLLDDTCQALVVSGQIPGSTRRPPKAHTAEDLFQEVETEAGPSAQILRDPQMRQRLLAVLDADLRLGREAANLDSVHVTVPVHVLGGRSDRLIPADLLPTWAEHTTGECRVELLEGGHFALLAPENKETVERVLRTALRPTP
ncbi:MULTISPECIES: thioesterase II family protein [unclassified Streptomyces]|uniref:thioesterase II family protein n=1 Tax=unclassified Streptomyces TaxID=2593676 RepID=UPI003830AFCB